MRCIKSSKKVFMESSRIKATKGKVEMRSREVKFRIVGIGRDQHIQL